MPIPKSTETKQPILQHLAKVGRPVKVSAITELMGQHFKLSKKEMEERTPKGLKRFAMCINTSTKEMKAAGLAKSPRYGFLEITLKGRRGLAGSTTQVVTATNGRRKPGRPAKAQVKAPINGRRKLGRPKAQPATHYSIPRQPSVTPIKRDDKLLQKAVDIVISYVGKNAISANQIPELIEDTYVALAKLGT